MRTRDIGKRIAAEKASEQMNLTKLLSEMEDHFLVLVDKEPDSDSSFMLHTPKGVRYAIRYPKSSWRLQRQEQEDRIGEIEAYVESEGEAPDSSNLR